MTIYKEFSFGGKKSPLGSFGGILGLALFLVAMYFLVKGIFWILGILTPVFLICAAIFDYKVFIDYFNFIIKLLKENPVFGLVMILITIVAFPAVSGYLFIKAWGRKKVKDYEKQVKNESERFDQYEEVKDEEDFLELPKVQHKQEVTRQTPDQNEYDGLFK